jgi:hypothetical protein
MSQSSVTERCFYVLKLRDNEENIALSLPGSKRGSQKYIGEVVKSIAMATEYRSTGNLC